MILEGLKNNNSVEIDGESNIRKATISGDKLAKLQYILTKGLYEEPITAVIAEWTNNAIDSVVQAGKNPVENPAIVSINKNSQGQYIFSVKDTGKGLDDFEFENLLMSYLESSKEDDPESIGCWGLGAKSFLSLERAATFTCIKEGIERRYLVYEGAEFAEYDLIYTKETQESNGVTAEITIKDYYEYVDFKQKAKQKLCYYDTAILIIDNQVVENKIYRNDLFQWSSLNTDKLAHFSIKDVYYQIDYKKLNLPEIYLSVCLKFNLNSKIKPTPSREGIIWTKDTIELFRNRVKEIANFFVERYNSENKEFDSFLDAYNSINTSSKYLSIEGKQFNITELERYSDVKFEEPKIKEIELKNGKYYKEKVNEFLEEYIAIAWDDNSSMWKKKHISFELSVKRALLKEKTVIFNEEGLSGNVKEYLRDKHGRNTLYIQKVKNRKLDGTLHFEGYKSLLLLTKDNKKEWRELIKEWQFVQKSVTDKFIDETDVENREEYIQWLQEKKSEQKENRAKGIYKGTSLNKDKTTEITISTARFHKYEDSLVYDRGTAKISELHKRKFLTIFASIEDSKSIQLFHIKKALKGKISIAIIGERELKYINNKHNFIELKDFYMSKPFARLSTAILINRLLERVPNSRQEYITETFPKWKELFNKLREYKIKNVENDLSSATEEAILQQAAENNCYDGEILPDYNAFKAIIDDFYFLHLLEKDSYYDTEELKKEKKKLVASLLLLQKYKKKELELTPIIPVSILEDMYIGSDGNLENCLECQDVFEGEGELVDEDFIIESI